MSQAATKGVSGTVLVCVVLTSGALCGVAAQVLLRHLGLDLSSVRNDLVAGPAAPLRLTLAWWSWWLVAVLAFFVGRSSAALTRVLVANWWLFRNLRLLCSAAVILALAVVGRLPASRPDLGGTHDAAMGLGILALSTVLAALGARSAFAIGQTGAPATRTQAGRGRAWSPVGSLPLVLHGGSINSGLPSLGIRYGYALAGAATRSGRRALAAMQIGIAVAGLSALGSAAVVLELHEPKAIRETVESKGAASGSTRGSMKLRPARASAAVGELRDTSVPLPPLPLRQPTAVVGAYAMVATDENELTFAKGYARRRAALEAAGIKPAQARMKAVTEVRPGRGAAWRAPRHNRLNQFRRYDFYGAVDVR